VFDPVTALAALAPVAVDAGRALVQKYLAPDAVKPLNMAELLQLRTLENDRLRILQDSDKGGDTYKWVEAIRKMQRPVVVFVTLGAFVMEPSDQIIADLFAVVMFYLFGERTRTEIVKRLS
jgi:hypothetical protein